MPTQEEPNDRLRQEIEEILEKEERKTVEPIRIVRPVKPRRARTGTPIWAPTPEKLIVLGMVILLAAVIVRSLVLPLSVTGIVLAGIGYYWLVRRKRAQRFGAQTGSGSGHDEVKYWRGKPITPKTRDGNIVEFPDTMKNKARRRFGRKR